jgi:ABC-type lipoprotein export system ATPase subunit
VDREEVEVSRFPRIKRLTLKNFKMFEDVDIEFGDFNVIVGANASGKSSLLSAFVFMQQLFYSDNLAIPRRFYTRGNPRLPLEFGIHLEMHHKINSGLNRLNGTQIPLELIIHRIEYKCCSSLNTDETDFIFNESASITVSNAKAAYGRHRFNVSYKQEGDGPISITSNNSIRNSDFNESLEALINVVSTETSTLSFLASGNRMLSPLNIMKNLRIYNFNPKDVKETDPLGGRDRFTLPYWLASAAQDNKWVLEDFASIVRRFIPSVVKIHTEKRDVTDDTPFDDPDEYTFVVTEESGEHRFSMYPSSISDGSASIIGLIYITLYANDPVLVLEEPDRHLHPKLISKLVNLFQEASERRQVFITTHNPEVLRYINPDDLYFVSRKQGGVSTVFKPTIEKEMVKEYLKNELGVDELFRLDLLDQ